MRSRRLHAIETVEDPVNGLVRAVVFASGALAMISMLVGPSFASTPLFGTASITVAPFDLLLLCAAAAFLLSWSNAPLARLATPGRFAVSIVVIYIAYELLTLLPYAVLMKHVPLTTAIRLMEPRFMMFFVAFFSLVGFARVSHRTVISMWNIVGLVIAVVVIFRLAAYGPAGYWSGDVMRLRMVYGPAVLSAAWLLIVNLIAPRTRRWTSLYIMPAAGVVGLVLVNHRGAYLALAVAGLAYLLLHLRSEATRFRVVVTVITFVFFASLAAYAIPSVGQSLAYSISTTLNPHADKTASDRVGVVPLSLAFFEQHPFGDSVWDNALTEAGFTQAGLPGPENFVLALLVTEGVVGLVAWLAILGAGLVAAWRRRRTDRIAEAMLYYLIFLLVFALTNGTFGSLGALCLLASALALAFGRDSICARSDKSTLLVDAYAVTVRQSRGEAAGLRVTP